jgi:hypothetical protein
LIFFLIFIDFIEFSIFEKRRLLIKQYLRDFRHHVILNSLILLIDSIDPFVITPPRCSAEPLRTPPHIAGQAEKKFFDIIIDLILWFSW